MPQRQAVPADFSTPARLCVVRDFLFYIDEDLSWRQGTWKLEKWERDNHGVKEDDTKSYNYQLLIIKGSQKYSELIERSEAALDPDVNFFYN